MTKEMLKRLSRKELFVYAAEANSKPNDRELLDQITDELKERNAKELETSQKQLTQ